MDDDAVSAIYRAMEYIEDHLRDDVRLVDLAAAAGYSLFHFSRTFNRIVRHTPYDYLMRRRLSEAALALIHTEQRIIDIAVTYQFHSAEVFTRAFRRIFACQPSECRACGQIDPRCLFPPHSRSYLDLLSQASMPPPAQVNLPELRLAGMMTSVSTPGDRSDLWDLLLLQPGLEKATGGRWPDAPPAVCFGVRLYPLGWEGAANIYRVCKKETDAHFLPESRFYFAGIQAPGEMNFSPPLVSLVLPPRAYAAFSIPSNISMNAHKAYVYGTWLPQMGIDPAREFELERFDSTLGYPPIVNQLLYPLER